MYVRPGPNGCRDIQRFGILWQKVRSYPGTPIGVPPSPPSLLPLSAAFSGCLHHPNANAHLFLLLLPPRKLSRVLAARRLHLGRFWLIQFIYACMYRINILFDSGGGLRGFRTAKLVLKENAMYSECMCVRALMYEPRIMESLTSLSERGEQWTHRSEKHRASNL